MLKLFYQGGPLFMGILTLILISLLVVFILSLIRKGNEKHTNNSLQWLKSLGILGLVVGILGQLIGLYSAFSIMETGTEISPSMLAGGLKVSMTTTLYGFLIYIIHLLCAMVIRSRSKII